ncbi:hypothetical protein THRCLA_05580 [Thraustotheca clavata]|uniref:Uncharacterized protein n=1 Tax=Thraustotheca clavata TaxID=74557 RepID=A0A1V9ZW51_9STRA|nr:hypothetical protein THRCLA_05580 [Thraustotheca clavata]
MGSCKSKSSSEVTQFSPPPASPLKPSAATIGTQVNDAVPVLPNAVGVATPPIETGIAVFLRHVKKGSLSEMMMALDKDPTLLNARGMWESTPLIYACQYIQAETAAYLISHGADTLLLNEKNVSALLLACLEGMTSILAMLLQDSKQSQVPLLSIVGVVYNSYADKNQTLTPFVGACSNGHLECVGLLLQAVAQPESTISTSSLVNEVPPTVISPLFAAAIYGHTHVLMMLLNYGATTDIVDTDGNTVLLLALLHGHDVTASTLLKAVNRPSIRTTTNALGMSPLHMAADKGCIESCKALLVPFGDVQIDIDAVNQAQETPLLLAARRRNGTVLEALIRAGANIDKEVPGGKSVREILTKDKRLNLIEMADKLHHQERSGSSSSMLPALPGDSPISTPDPAATASREAPRPSHVGRKTRITFSKQLGTTGMPLLQLDTQPQPETPAPLSPRKTRVTFSRQPGVPMAPVEFASDVHNESGSGEPRRVRTTFSKPPSESTPHAKKTQIMNMMPADTPLIQIPTSALDDTQDEPNSFSLLETTNTYRLDRIQSVMDAEIFDRMDRIESINNPQLSLDEDEPDDSGLHIHHENEAEESEDNRVKSSPLIDPIDESNVDNTALVYELPVDADESNVQPTENIIEIAQVVDQSNVEQTENTIEMVQDVEHGQGLSDSNSYSSQVLQASEAAVSEIFSTVRSRQSSLTRESTQDEKELKSKVTELLSAIPTSQGPTQRRMPKTPHQSTAAIDIQVLSRAGSLQASFRSISLASLQPLEPSVKEDASRLASKRTTSLKHLATK